MIYAQFYHYDLAGELAEACGDRSVVIIDARLRMATIGEIAAEECKKRGYVAWAIFRGQSFTNSRPLSDPWYVDQSKPARTNVEGMDLTAMRDVTEVNRHVPRGVDIEHILGVYYGGD